MKEVKFRDGVDICTLYVEKVYDDGWFFGYCVERDNHFSVHPDNVLGFPAEVNDANRSVHDPSGTA